MYAFEENCSKLEKLIQLLPQNRSYFCMGVEKPLVAAIQSGFNKVNFKKTLENYVDAYFYNHQNVPALINCAIPTHIKLQSLSEVHVPQIDVVYPHHGPTTADQFKKLIKFNVNVGVFDDDNNLLGWCMKHQSGTLSALQVEEKYKRQGFGSLIVKHMVEELAKNDEDTLAFVDEDNFASKSMFEKVGFKSLGLKVAVMEYIPTISS